MTLKPGDWLNHYEILGHLGSGGMGEVYRARDNKLQREVALKVLPKAFAQDPERLARFRREAQVLAQLNHVNIAAIYNLEQSGETHFLVMELALGDTLRDRIKRSQSLRGSAAVSAAPGSQRDAGATSRPVPVEEALDISKQIAAGLECAHEKPIVHRDLKPANIKVTPEGVVKILDFGLARAFSGDSGSGGNPPGPDSPTLSAMPRRERSWARRRTCRRNRHAARKWISAPTSGRSAACCMNSSPASKRFRAAIRAPTVREGWF